jgi:hypothetical protein
MGIAARRFFPTFVPETMGKRFSHRIVCIVTVCVWKTSPFAGGFFVRRRRVWNISTRVWIISTFFSLSLSPKIPLWHCPKAIWHFHGSVARGLVTCMETLVNTISI